MSGSTVTNAAAGTVEVSVADAMISTAPFDKVTSKGQENGLFQSCMKAIRSAHFQSNRVRALIVVAGLFTDIRIYCDVISIFYVVTKEIEEKLKQLELTEKDPICHKLLALGYRFTEAYEKDLEFLYRTISTRSNTSPSASASPSARDGEKRHDWKAQVEALVARTPAAVAYRDRIRSMTSGHELAGAVFCIWGALVIGGGAIAMPRVKTNYGVEATHIYQSVTGPGREQRKRQFIQTWDSLLLDNGNETLSASTEFEVIVKSSRECMQCNNNVLSSIIRNPWWLSPVAVAGAVGVLSVTMAAILAWQRKRTL